MRRANIDALLRFRIEPGVKCAAAGKFQGIDRAIRIDHGKFKVAVERGSNEGCQSILADLYQSILRTADVGRGRAIQSIELAGAGGHWATFWIAVGSVADLLVLQ